VAIRATRLPWPNTPRVATPTTALRAAVTLVLVRDCFEQLWQRVRSSVHQRQLPQFSVGLYCMADKAFLVQLALPAYSGNQKGGISESVPISCVTDNARDSERLDQRAIATCPSVRCQNLARTAKPHWAGLKVGMNSGCRKAGQLSSLGLTRPIRVYSMLGSQ
jgi:hypothetical protein